MELFVVVAASVFLFFFFFFVVARGVCVCDYYCLFVVCCFCTLLRFSLDEKKKNTFQISSFQS